MENTIWINDLSIKADNYHIEIMEENGVQIHQLELVFKVTQEMYHDVTVELYKNDFMVKIPKENIEFHATIKNYFTSVTNLYKENAVGDFTLVLIEKQ